MQTFYRLRKKAIHKVTGVVSLHPVYESRGSVLLSYLTQAFLLSPPELEKVRHTNYWECREIAYAFLEAGYNVDVINWDNSAFKPRKTYAFCLDIQHNLERFASLLGPNCIKIFFIEGSHWLFQNTAEYTRLLNLQRRRGIVLTPQRNVVPNHAIEHADYVIGLGNGFVHNTYSFSKKIIAPIALSTMTTFSSPAQKDFDACRKNFVWLGGGGAVHKGLDLVLECFATMPDYSLTVCGPVHAEKDFAAAYSKELFETPNIRTVGRIDVRGKQFAEIVAKSLALIYPSCSEGQSGSVVTAMHAGLIPIISRASGVDADEFGIMLEQSSPEEIKTAVLALSSLPADVLAQKAKTTWKYAREHHTRERFARTFREFIRTIMETHHL
ncbi:MAG: glycosyltransferase [Candidatus Sungbacteria bacterium]|nr:glycosyltransferase [Candidatus Sungbacteria bacterium]